MLFILVHHQLSHLGKDLLRLISQWWHTSELKEEFISSTEECNGSLRRLSSGPGKLFSSQHYVFARKSGVTAGPGTACVASAQR